MRFLSVADRELRTAARQKVTYRTRWLTAVVFFGLLVWLLWALHGFATRGTAPKIFSIYSILTFLYCLFVGTARTADCISSERREGTLGLLFLTNLNSAEIIAGKLCSSALASVYGFMAVFPMLALMLLMGGVTFGTFGRTVLGLLNGILFALAAGFLSSVVCKRQFTAIALALGLTLSGAFGLMLGAEAADLYAPTRPLAKWVALFSPLYTLAVADGTRGRFGPNHFWYSAAVVSGMSLACLGLAAFLLARTWRDRPTSSPAWRRGRLWRRSERTQSVRREEFRRRMLAINPLYWLAGRQAVSAPVIMVLAVALTIVTVYMAAPFFGRLLRAGTATAVAGHLFAWLWTGLAIHALVLYYAAMSASRPLAEDKQAGALELILSTPTTERTISRGLWLAYWRKMLFPALLAMLVHFFFIWMCMVMASLDPPGPIPAGTTPGEIFWSALLGTPLRGRAIDWQFGFLLHIALLLLVLLMAAWSTLGWVGRWLGLRMKRPGFAPVTSLALLFVPPILLFSLACYLADKFGIARLPERRFLPMAMWWAFGIGIGHCLGLSAWAANRLKYHLRPVAMSRYQPLPRWRLRLPSWRTVRRFAIATAIIAIAIPSLVVSYYGYQNWRSRRAWRGFQARLKQSGEPLSLASLLPKPVADDANLARAPEFLGLRSRKHLPATNVFERVITLSGPISSSTVNNLLMDWNQQTNSELRYWVGGAGMPVRMTAASVPPNFAVNMPRRANRLRQQSSGGPETKRTDDAAAILHALEPESGRLRELAAALVRCPGFQTSTNRDASAVLHPDEQQIVMFEQLHLLFQVRACASLALGRNADAAEDVLAGLRLANLARQIPDVRSTEREQVLLMRSLQPLWEGLSQHAWTEPQLASFQHQLAGFNLLADYTNAVRRVVLANIEVWQTIPDSTNSHLSAQVSGRVSERASRLEPRAWWFDSCISLHNVGRFAIEQVDCPAGRVQQGMYWSELQGLPLDSESQQFFQQQWWWGANPAWVGFAQTSLNQAIIACALERFRLAHGAYPETLEHLVPSLLVSIPHDAISGRPIIYQPPGDGSFILRGVGPNGLDDRKNNPSDDWLWTYPTNAPSPKK